MFMLTNLPEYIAYMRKALIQFLTLVITLGTAVVTFNNLPDKYASIITGVVGVAGTILHYATPNAPAPGQGTAEHLFDVSSLPSDDVDDTNPEFQPAAVITTDEASSVAPVPPKDSDR
jgi:hypothetical protein